MLEDWEQWGLEEDPNNQEKMVCDSYMAMMKAASAGLGVAMGLFPITNAWLNKGLLASPLMHGVTTPYAYWVCAPGDYPHPATDAFFKWSRSLFEQIPDIENND
jgi:DNA-binding transcriptional LysR family regulator